jgi:hypothetical protein
MCICVFCFYSKQLSTCFFSILFSSFFSCQEKLCVSFLYNISGNLEWCVCVYVYSSLLRSFPLWPCCVGGFFSFSYLYIYIYIFFFFILFVHIDRLERSSIRSVFFFFFFFSPFDDNNIAICTIE